MPVELIPKLQAMLATEEILSEEMIISALAEEIEDLDSINDFLMEVSSQVELKAQTFLMRLTKRKRETEDASTLLERLEKDEAFRKAFISDPLGVLRENVTGLTLPLEDFAIMNPTEIGCSAAKKSVVAEHVDLGCSAAKKSYVVPSSVDLGCSAAKKSKTLDRDMGCSAAKKSKTLDRDMGCSAAKKS